MIITRIFPRRIEDSSWTSIAILSSSSVMYPWATRKWPRYSRWSDEEEEAIRPFWKKIRFSMPCPSTRSVPFLPPSESHCRSSERAIVRRFPVMPMRSGRLAPPAGRARAIPAAMGFRRNALTQSEPAFSGSGSLPGPRP